MSQHTDTDQPYERLDAAARAALSTGERVVTAYLSAGVAGKYRFETVTATTDTQLTLSDGNRYMKRTGRQIGGYARRHIMGRALPEHDPHQAPGVTTAAPAGTEDTAPATTATPRAIGRVLATDEDAERAAAALGLYRAQVVVYDSPAGERRTGSVAAFRIEDHHPVAVLATDTPGDNPHVHLEDLRTVYEDAARRAEVGHFRAAHAVTLAGIAGGWAYHAEALADLSEAFFGDVSDAAYRTARTAATGAAAAAAAAALAARAAQAEHTAAVALAEAAQRVGVIANILQPLQSAAAEAYGNQERAEAHAATAALAAARARHGERDMAAQHPYE